MLTLQRPPGSCISRPQIDGDDEEKPVALAPLGGEEVAINFEPSNAYEFGQSLNAARCSGSTAACAELLGRTAPEALPELLGSQLDGHTVGFMVQALHCHLVEKNPGLVYQHLQHLHTVERFSVREKKTPVGLRGARTSLHCTVLTSGPRTRP